MEKPVKGCIGVYTIKSLLGDKNYQEMSQITCPILTQNQAKTSGKHNFQGEIFLLDSQLIIQ